MTTDAAPTPERRYRPCRQCKQPKDEPTFAVIVNCQRIWLCTRHRALVRNTQPAKRRGEPRKKSY